MTYDNYNQLESVQDSGGRKISYKYTNRGELLSTSNPNTKESNGKKYDRFGNVIESSPVIAGNRNLLINGSMEIPGTGGNLLANWTRQGASVSATLEGFNSHGNSALKMSSTNYTTDWFYQTISGIFPGDMLTLRADVQLDNVTSPSNNGGAYIELNYGNYSEGWYVFGSGTVPLILTSKSTGYTVTAKIGFYNAKGNAWFDGAQLENAGGARDDFKLSYFNSVENNGFEQNLSQWSYIGAPWISNQVAWEGTHSLTENYSSDGYLNVYQDVSVYGGEPLTFSGMVKTNSVIGNAYFRIDYYDASNNLISNASVETGYVSGTQDWTRLTTIATAYETAKKARVQGIFIGGGTIYFDNIKLIPRISAKYTYDNDGNYLIKSEDALGKQNSYTYRVTT